MSGNGLVVVGGGLVGSVLAMYLARRGHAIQVFERHPDPRQSGNAGVRPSINLTLCKRGLDALAAIGLRDHVLSRATPLQGRRIHATDGTISHQPYGNRGEAIYSISRTALAAALIEVASREPGVEYHFEQKCVRLDAANGVVHFENLHGGRITTVRGERVFGADGAHSAVRAQLQKTERFNYSQEYSTLGYKELTLPRLPNGESPLDADALHVWPRGAFMLLGFPNHDQSVTLALHAAFRGEESFEKLHSEAELVAFMRRWFPDVADRIPRLSEQFFERPANSMVTIRCEPWSSSGRVLLVGDAAHAILPFYGQGANAGFEDCAVLARALDIHGNDWDAVFADYERQRRPNMDVMAELCMDHFVELRDRLGDPRFLLRKRLERRLEQLYPTRFTPLYSLVTFTCTPYAEALRIEHGQRRLVDRLLEVDDIEASIHRPEIRSIVESFSEEVA